MQNMSKDILDSPFFSSKSSGVIATPLPSDVPLTPIDKMPRFISTKDSGDKVFLVENGVAHWIQNPDALKALGGGFDRVVQVTKQDYMQLDRGGESITVDNAGKYAGQPTDDEFYGKGEVEIALEEEKKFKVYEEKPKEITENLRVENAPITEPVKGFTSIIIPAYLASYFLFHQTGHCIGSVHEHTDKEKTPYEIILVINGKTGILFDKPEMTMADKVIDLPENLGYGGGMNKGIRVAKGEYVVLLSNDVLVFDHWLEDFHLALGRKDLVMATPMYGEPYARARESNIKRNAYQENHGPRIVFNDFRDFSCVAARKSLFDEIGLFDEKFFAYKEDLDIMNRMDKAGKTYGTTGPVGDALINTFHIIGNTSVDMSQEQLHKKEGEEYYKEKYGSA